MCNSSISTILLNQLKLLGMTYPILLKEKMPGNYNVNHLGFNYRMNELEASIGIEQLKKINVFLKKENLIFII